METMLIHMFPIRNTGLLLRRTALLNRSFYSGNLVYRTERLIGPCYMKSKNAVSPIFKRSFASSNSSYSFPIRSLVFFTLSSLGIVGGFYVISYSLRVSFDIDFFYIVFKCIQSWYGFSRTLS